MKLNVKAFTYTTGLIWGFGLFFITWWIILFEGSTDQTNLISQVYRGYTVSPWGSLVGLAWGLVDGAIGGLVFAWLYNLFAGRSSE